MVVCCSQDSINVNVPGESAYEIADKFGCSFFVASLLEMRGISLQSSSAEVESWLAPNMCDMLEKVDLGAGNNTAVGLINGLNENSDVVVYGDYDVDGISATTLAIEILMSRRAHVRYFIPHRFNQGYGVHKNVASNIAKRKCDLVVIVDCGSQDVDAIKLIKDRGIPVVVFDHHLIEETVADCDAMINPQLSGDFLAKRLCATEVLWCWAWQNNILPKAILTKLLDIVALATIADCVSMASPLNRVLVKEGVAVLKKNPRPGLAILFEKLGISLLTLSTDDLAMKTIPCLNAAGRLYLADLAVDILFPSSNLAAKVDKIIALNQKRRELSSKILEEVNRDSSGEFRFVLTDNDWSVGVLSSVASRICSERNAPVALVASAGDIMRGTLRMPAGGDAMGILKVLAPILSTWGGHRLAAGFSVKKENWPALREKMEEMLSRVTVINERENLLYWSPSKLDIDMWYDAIRLGPFGMENSAPRLYFPNKGDIRISPLGKNGKHVRITTGGSVLLGFKAADFFTERSELSGFIYKPRVDFWHNNISLQLILDKLVVR